MQQKTFALFCGSIKRAFDVVNGAIAQCLSKKAGVDITVCAGTASNDRLSVDKVSVWDNKDDSKLYCGPLDNPELRKLLTANKVCGAEITNSSALGAGRTGAVHCFGDFESCTVSDCPYKKNLVTGK